MWIQYTLQQITTCILSQNGTALLKKCLPLGLKAQASNPSTGEAEQEECEFKTSLGYIVNPRAALSQKTKKPKMRETER
jgi:hypothetical protein